MDFQEKRELRELKRVVKRAGNKRRRRLAKGEIAAHPEDAHALDDVHSYGRYRSADLNGLDRDSTRRRPE